jgi:hypothetical protein
MLKLRNCKSVEVPLLFGQTASFLSIPPPFLVVYPRLFRLLLGVSAATPGGHVLLQGSVTVAICPANLSEHGTRHRAAEGGHSFLKNAAMKRQLTGILQPYLFSII